MRWVRPWEGGAEGRGEGPERADQRKGGSFHPVGGGRVVAPCVLTLTLSTGGRGLWSIDIFVARELCGVRDPWVMVMVLAVCGGGDDQMHKRSKLSPSVVSLLKSLDKEVHPMTQLVIGLMASQVSD
jgi:hypothetical protein